MCLTDKIKNKDLIARFGNYSLIRQNLLEFNNRKIDKLELRLEDGQQIEVYFDITEFFGKGFEF